MPPALLAFALALAAAVGSMGAYALRGRRPDADAARKGSRFLLGVGDFLVHWLMWVLRPVEAASLRAGLPPEAFNFAGLGFGILAGALIAAGQLELGGWAIALGGICDILDGRIARATGTASDYGKFLDSTLDRFVEASAFLGFAVHLRGFAWGPLAVVAAACGSLLVSYTRARGESVGVVCTEGLMQRAERLVLLCLACLLDPSVSARYAWPPGTVAFWAIATIAGGTVATAVQRTVWIALRLRRR